MMILPLPPTVPPTLLDVTLYAIPVDGRKHHREIYRKDKNRISYADKTSQVPVLFLNLRAFTILRDLMLHRVSKLELLLEGSE
jgi:hypothetical protein